MDIIEETDHAWTVEDEDGTEWLINRNAFGQYLITAKGSGVFSTLEDGALEVLLHLAKQERL